MLKRKSFITFNHTQYALFKTIWFIMICSEHKISNKEEKSKNIENLNEKCTTAMEIYDCERQNQQ